MHKKILIVLTLIISSIISYSQKSAIFEIKGKAINGYDVVAYHTRQQPIKGHDSLSFEWSSSTWFFSSTANLELFRKNPEKFSPQYGGYCAYGTAGGYKASTQPDAWAIVNDKLYFNYNYKVKENWDKDQATYIYKADANWPLIKDKK